jgi:hypothetical protein
LHLALLPFNSMGFVHVYVKLGHLREIYVVNPSRTPFGGSVFTLQVVKFWSMEVGYGLVCPWVDLPFTMVYHITTLPLSWGSPLRCPCRKDARRRTGHLATETPRSVDKEGGNPSEPQLGLIWFNDV